MNLYHCIVCQDDIPLDAELFTLDYRVQRLEVEGTEEIPVTAVRIVHSEIRCVYCSEVCWRTHEPKVRARLELMETWPAASFVTPCGRCRRPVSRTRHHVCFSRIRGTVHAPGGGVMEITPSQERDYAVLCRACLNPGTSDPVYDTESAQEQQPGGLGPLAAPPADFDVLSGMDLEAGDEAELHRPHYGPGIADPPDDQPGGPDGGDADGPDRPPGTGPWSDSDDGVRSGPRP